jgi:hypothetical protein
VATELDGHDGPSVIRSWPALAPQIVTTCDVPPEATTWVQHDPPDAALSLEENFSWVMPPGISVAAGSRDLDRSALC